MEIELLYNKKKYKIKLKNNSTIRDTLYGAKINPETVIVKKGKMVVTLEEKLKNNDKIEALRIVSGG